MVLRLVSAVLVGLAASPNDAAGDIRVNGRVSDSNGRSVANALVTLRTYYLGEVHSRSFSTQSAEDGTFELEFPAGVRESDMLHAWAYAKGYAIRTIMLRRLLNGEEEVKDVQIVLRKAESVTYRVVSPSGKPFVGALVHPWYVEVPNGTYQADEPTGLTSPLPDALAEVIGERTDANGNVSIDAIPKLLRHSVAVKADGYGSQEFREPANDLQLGPVGSVRGEVVGIDPNRYAGVHIYLKTLDRAHQRAGVAEGKVNEDGTFEFPEVAAGGFMFWVVGWPRDQQTLPYTESRTGLIAPRKACQLRIEARPTVTISGRLLTSDTRQPVVKARISIRNLNSPVLGQHVETDANGYFDGRALPGRTSLQVVFLGSDESMSRIYDHPRIPNVQIPSDVETWQIDDILVQPQQLLSGTLLGVDGQPRANVKLGLRSGSFRHMMGTTQTAANGKFQIRVRNWKFLAIEKTKWVSITNAASQTESPRMTELEVVSTEPLVLSERD